MKILIDDDTFLVATQPVGPFQMNEHVIVDRESGEAAIIDAGGDPAPFLKLVEDAGAKIIAIWQTHGHIDHIMQLRETKAITDAPIYLHPDDQIMLDRAVDQARHFGIPDLQPPDPDHDLAEGDVMKLGKHSFEVLHTPGHAPGHVCFYSSEHGFMFGGDLLFRQSIGRTDLPGCDISQMKASLRRVAALPEETRVFPGHMIPTTIGLELKDNPFLQQL